MRSSFMVIPEENVVLILIRGNVTFIEYLNLMMDICKDPEYELSFNLLFDCRRVKSFLTGEDWVEYWNMMEFGVGQMGKIAILMDPNKPTWSKELELFLNDNRAPFEYNVFQGARSIKEYLEISDELYAEYPVINRELLTSAESGKRYVSEEKADTTEYEAQRKLLSGIYMERVSIKQENENLYPNRDTDEANVEI